MGVRVPGWPTWLALLALGLQALSPLWHHPHGHDPEPPHRTAVAQATQLAKDCVDFAQAPARSACEAHEAAPVPPHEPAHRPTHPADDCAVCWAAALAQAVLLGVVVGVVGLPRPRVAATMPPTSVPVRGRRAAPFSARAPPLSPAA